MLINMLLPAQKLLLVRSGATAEAGQNHMVKFQTLGFVNGHNLDNRLLASAVLCISLIRRGGGVELVHRQFKTVPIGEGCASLPVFQQVQIAAGIAEIGTV